MTPEQRDAETLRLASEYRKACANVQMTWRAFLEAIRTVVCTGAGSEYDPNAPVDIKGPAWRAHRSAQDYAADRHRVLIAHVSGGDLEVGQ